MEKKLLAVLAVLVGVSGLGVGSWWLVRAPKRASARQLVSAVPAHPSDIEGDVRALRDKVRSLQLQTKLTTLAQAEAGQTEDHLAAEHGDPPQAEAESAEAAEQRREVYLAEVDQGFRAEAVDRNWSPRVTAEIVAALRSPEIKLEASAVECRAKSCRLELPNDDPGALQKGIPLFVNRLGSTLPQTVAHQVTAADGKTSTVIYLFRDGPPASVADPRLTASSGG